MSKDKLGSGASSVVYKAVDVATGQPVAVKRIRKLEAETVSGAMTPFPVHLNPTATMQEAAALMLRRNLNRVLITEPGSEKFVGISSSTDVFRLAFGDAAAQWREEGTEKAGL